MIKKKIQKTLLKIYSWIYFLLWTTLLLKILDIVSTILVVQVMKVGMESNDFVVNLWYNYGTFWGYIISFLLFLMGWIIIYFFFYKIRFDLKDRRKQGYKLFRFTFVGTVILILFSIYLYVVINNFMVLFQI